MNNVALVGGPMHGQLIVLPHIHTPFEVARPEPLSLNVPIASADGCIQRGRYDPAGRRTADNLYVYTWSGWER